jgi:hypothetical protein
LQPLSALILHTLLALAILAAYTALTVTGHDGNALLALLGGQALGAGINVAAAPPK